jgi:hypothetical protein
LLDIRCCLARIAARCLSLHAKFPGLCANIGKATLAMLMPSEDSNMDSEGWRAPTEPRAIPRFELRPHLVLQ